MAVAFDAVGPSSTGAATGTDLTLGWTHTPVAAGTYVLAGIAVGSNTTDAAYTVAATYATLPMTPLGRWESGGSGQTVGFLAVFITTAAVSGSPGAVSVSVSGPTAGTITIEGGSLGFTGASGSYGTIGTANSGGGSVTSGSVSVASTTSGNMCAAFVTDGSGGLAWTAGTTRYSSDGGAGHAGAAQFCYGATAASTGSAVAFTFTQTSDYYAAAAFELLAAPTGTDTSPAYAGTATDLGGGSGTWATPTGAQGAPDSSTYAVWTSP